MTPGWLRSEKMLENFGVTEANWRDACRERPGFGISESPTYVARGVAALAGAADAERWAGTIISARQLADAYGVTDTDGSRPDCWGYHATYGWEPEDGRGIDEFGKSEQNNGQQPEGTSRRLRLRDVPEHWPRARRQPQCQPSASTHGCRLSYLSSAALSHRLASRERRGRTAAKSVSFFGDRSLAL